MTLICNGSLPVLTCTLNWYVAESVTPGLLGICLKAPMISTAVSALRQLRHLEL